MTTSSSSSPAVADQIRELHRLAVACGYDDAIWGALVIAATVIVEAKARIDAGETGTRDGWG